MKNFLCLFFLCFSVLTYSQQRYLISFKDKGPDQEAKLSDPSSFLSPHSLERRAKFHIPMDEKDIPIEKDYLCQVSEKNIKVIAGSKWLNLILAEGSDEDIEAIKKLPFVLSVQKYFAPKTIRTSSSQIEKTNAVDYGTGVTQTKMLGLEYMHDKGFTGKNVIVTICDGGFYYVDSLTSFSYVRNQNHILFTWDFVDHKTDVYREDSHGMSVLSTFVCNRPGEFVGTAIDVKVILARTENVFSETRQEEFNWVNAMEWADSIGTDIIHSSLGYNEFNDPKENYSRVKLTDGLQ